MFNIYYLNSEEAKMKAKGFFVFLAVVLSACIFFGCSESKESDYYNGGEKGPAMNEESGTAVDSTERKIVYRVTCNIEASDVEDSVEIILDNVKDSGGYVESSRSNSSGNTYAEFVIRIPTEKLEEFTAKFKDYGKVLSQSKSAEDITARYINMEAIIDAKSKELEILQEKVEESSSAADIKTYTARITELQIELNNYERQLAGYNNLVEYSTINIYLYEQGKAPAEVKYSTKLEKTFFGALNVFANVFKYLFLAIVAVAPFAVVGGGAAAGIYFGVKKYKAKKAKNAPEDQKNEDNKEKDD